MANVGALSPPEGNPDPTFLSGGEMGALMQAHDWSTSPVGDPSGWPQSLRSVVGLMLANRHLMFVAWGPELALLYNDGYAPVLGAKHPAALGRPLQEVWPEIWHDIEPLVATALGGEATWSENFHLVMERNGYPEDCWFTFSYSPVRDESGAIVGLFCAGGEITASVLAERERAHAQAEEKASEERYRTLFEAIDVGFCIVELKFDASQSPIDYRLVEVNPAFERQAGLYGAAGKWVSEAAPDLKRHWFDICSQVALTGEAARFENQPEPFGRWYDVHAFRTGAPEQHRVAILFNDITERKAAGDRLRELNQVLESRVDERTAERDRLWTLSEDMLARADLTGMMSAVSPAWTRVLGFSESELLARPYADFMHPDDSDTTLAALVRMGETGAPMRFENRIVCANGKYKVIDWTVAPERDGLNFIAVGRDTTADRERTIELEQAQQALRQSQKMDAMGQLTGGVAHDFNNLLTPIVGSLDLLQRKGLGGEREMRLIEGGLQAAERAKTLVQRLLAFARRQPLQAQPVDVTALMHGMADLVASTTGPQIKVTVDAPSDLPSALADQNQVEMALLNLSVNARDAMPDGGFLSLTAEAESIGPGHRSGLSPGRFVRLSVADTGSGMDEPTLARAIEPFFSTKGVGRGTGLGLSMVHGLASQLGGALGITSHVNVGTNVELWLPVSEDAPASVHESAAAAAHVAAGTVLLVDDEDLVRASTADMLGDLGYAVVEASSAEDALEQIDAGLAFDVLVTDHLMSGRSGTELARLLKQRLPGLRVLVVSGYAEVEGIAPELSRLSKPFRITDLAAKLAELNGAAPGN